jgi:hypothetical protein
VIEDTVTMRQLPIYKVRLVSLHKPQSIHLLGYAGNQNRRSSYMSALGHVCVSDYQAVGDSVANSASQIFSAPSGSILFGNSFVWSKTNGRVGC